MFYLLTHLKAKKIRFVFYILNLFWLNMLRNNGYKLTLRYGIFIGSIIICTRQASKVHVFYKISNACVARHKKTMNTIKKIWTSLQIWFWLQTFSFARHMLWNRHALSIHCKSSCLCIAVACRVVVVSKNSFLQVLWTLVLNNRTLHLKPFTIDAFHMSMTIHCNKMLSWCESATN